MIEVHPLGSLPRKGDQLVVVRRGGSLGDGGRIAVLAERVDKGDNKIIIEGGEEKWDYQG